MLFCVLEDVEASLTEVRILSSVIYSMIVVPQSSCILSVRIVIILVLLDAGGIFGPAVKGGARCEAGC